MFRTFKLLKNLVPGLIILTLILSLPGVGSESTLSTRQTTFTHTVLVEDITAIWCVYCPSASETLKAIYESGDLDFYFVCMITQDENSEVINEDAQQAADDYKISGYPTAVFDAGYEQISGGQSDETNYRAAIEDTGSRDVSKLGIDLKAYYVPDEKIKVEVSVNNHDTDTYSGNLRVYVTEIVSRYQDYDGNDYPFGFLDYAVNSDFSVEASGSYVTEATWDSNEATDAMGNPFGMPDPDNIMVIASIFNSQPSLRTSQPIYLANYADQTTGATLSEPPSDITPPSVSILQPENGNKVKGTIEIQAKVTDNVGVDSVNYRIDSQTSVPMTQSNSDPDIYTGSWDTTTVSDGTVTLYVDALDKSQNSEETSVSILVQNAGGSDTTPPSIEILSPGDNSKVQGSTMIQARVIDDWSVGSVQYQIDIGPVIDMYRTSSANTYEQVWDTNSVTDGVHTLTVMADDVSGNSNSELISVNVDNSGSPPTVDTTAPWLDIRNPRDGTTLQGTEEILVWAYDDKSGVSSVECALGSNAWLQLNNLGSNEWNLKLDTTLYPDGEYSFKFRAEDNAGNEFTDSVSVSVLNGFLDITKPTLKPLVPNKGDIISDVIEITIEAKDDVSIKYVEYQMDSKDWLQMINARNNVYQATFDTKDFDNGQHILTIRAVDDAGNTGEILLDVEISNSGAKSGREESGLPGFEAGLVMISVLAVVILMGKRKNE